MAKATSNEIGTRIGPETTIRAKVSGSEDLTVAGRVEGSIELLGTLIVEATGVVKAEVTVVRAIVAGIVVGDIEATESVQINAEARVLGDLRAPKITIAEGARFSGSIEMTTVDARDLPRHEPRRIEVREPELIRAEVVREPRRPVPPPPPLAPIVPPLFGTPQAPPVLRIEEDGESSPPVPALRPMDGRRKRVVVKKRS
jgi:cytoskeletal protein CcmA (bactofilin family)